ncbi:hypothetical protein [Microbacterium sp. NPDC057944]|uniref:hypothetical protein n=1 Tax=Microbacterium sp. NPDC057944 TaxID=3346286 RepID=UPI0036DCF69A
MRPTEAAREAARNLRAGVGASAWIAVILIALLAGAVILPQLALRDADARANAYQAAGAATLVVQAEGRIDGEQCDAFAALPNVVAAGAVRERASGTKLTLLPRTSARYFEATPGLADVLDADRNGGGLLLSSEVSDALGWSPGQSLLLDGTQAPVAGTFRYPDDGRLPAFSFAVIAETMSQGRFDECWITVWPQTDAVESLASLAVVEGSGGDGAGSGLKLVSANSSLGARFDVGPLAAVWTYAAAVCGVLAAVVALLFVRARRLELASARHVGVRRSDQLATLLLEVAVLLGLALLIVSPVALYLSLTAGASTTSSLHWYALRGVCAVLGGVVLGTVLGWASVRESHLFRYFKER